MNVLVSLEAERDNASGVAFYDASGREVGDYFYLSIVADVQSLSIFGGIHSKRLGYHCMSATRFPFAIYYFIIDATVKVIAVLDERRDPEWVHRRMSRE